MATAPQWPRPTGLDDRVDDPLVLVDRFKQHYISICHHTADNPTASASARYVLDVMFQANKVITLLAKEMSVLASRQQTEVVPTLDATKVGAQEESPTECDVCEDEIIRVDETRAKVEGEVDDGTEDIPDNVLGTIHTFNWGEADPEDEQDWKDDESSERDSEDEYYEYGNFGDEGEEEEEEEEELVNEDQYGNDGQIEQQDEETAAQEPQEANAEPVTEAVAGCTILEMDLRDEDSDQNWEDNGCSEHNSEDDYYEYRSFADDEKEEDVAEGEQQPEALASLEDLAEKAVENVQNATLGNIIDNDWGNEDSEEDQDWKGGDSSDHDSEDDYYEYGDFGDDDEDEPDDGAQPENPEAQATKIGYLGEYGSYLNPVKPGWRKVFEWPVEPESQEAFGHTSQTSAQSPDNAEAHFKIRWSCADSPYEHHNDHQDIIYQLHCVLAKSGVPKLKDICISSISQATLTGDLEVHLATADDKTCLTEHAKAWVPLLQRGDYARIPNVYYPRTRDNLAGAEQWDTPEQVPGLRLQWRCQHFSSPLSGVTLGEIWDMIKEALSRSDNPDLQKIRFPYMYVVPGAPDIVLHLNSRADRDWLFDNESAWVPKLPDGECARIVHVYDPEENPNITGAEIEQNAELPASNGEKLEQPPTLTIHWKSNAPYRDWGSYPQLSQVLDKMCEPMTTPDSTSPWSVAIDPDSGDVEILFHSSTYRTQAIENITTWFPLLDRSDVARVLGIYNPLRRAKSNAKMARRNHAPLSEAGQGKPTSTRDEVSTVQDGVNGLEVEGEKDGQSVVEAQNGPGLERKKSKKRFKKWQKLKKNEVLAC